VLEFTLRDSKNKLVQVSDKSQLFILLTILWILQKEKNGCRATRIYW
jgi:hypothetical protein